MKTATLATLLALLALIPLAAAETSYHETQVMDVEGQEYNFSAVSSNMQRVFITTPHSEFIASVGRCEPHDIYRICISSVTYREIDYYPYEYEINVSWEKTCEDCVGWGGACEESSECGAGVCVNDACRPEQPWCGDGVCDEGQTHESCPQDCPAPVAENNQTTNETTTDEPESNQTTNETTDELAEQPTQEQPIQEAPPPERTGGGIVEEDANWLAGSIILFGGFIAIIAVFNRKRKKQQQKQDDLYSYRK